MLAYDIRRVDHDGTDLPGVQSTHAPAANDEAYRLHLVPPGDPPRSNSKTPAYNLRLVPEPALKLYEEFHPYGTSAYRAVDSSIGVSARRYRYVGLERDEETGLDQMGARYYAPWLGRWTAADPIGLGDGVNRYAYVSGNPVRMTDPSGTRGGEAAELQQQRARAHGVRERAIHDATTMLNSASQELAQAGGELIAASQDAAASPGDEEAAHRVHIATLEVHQAQVGLDAANERLRHAYSSGYLPGDTLGGLYAEAGKSATQLGEAQAEQAGHFDEQAFGLGLLTDLGKELAVGVAEEFTFYGDVLAIRDGANALERGDIAAAAVAGVGLVASRKLSDRLSTKGHGSGPSPKVAPRLQGFTERQFRKFRRGARRVVREANLPKGELAVHGSRASGTARPSSDVDIALIVDEDAFFDFAQARISSVRPGTRLHRTLLHAARQGKLSRFAISREFNEILARELLPHSPYDVDFSIIKKGSKFDNGPFVSLGSP